jgi:hypothetical protein
MSYIKNDDRYKRAAIRVKELDDIDTEHGNKLPSEASTHAHLVTCLALVVARYGFDPCEVERCIQDGKPMPSDEVILKCLKYLANDWLHYREAGLEIVASTFRERLAAIVEAMKQLE